MNCAMCKRWQMEAAEADPPRKRDPICYTKHCDASEFMLPELGAWIGMFGLLQSEMLRGAVPMLLRKGKAVEADFDLFLDLDNLLNRYRIEKLKSK